MKHSEAKANLAHFAVAIATNVVGLEKFKTDPYHQTNLESAILLVPEVKSTIPAEFLAILDNRVNLTDNEQILMDEFQTNGPIAPAKAYELLPHLNKNQVNGVVGSLASKGLIEKAPKASKSKTQTSEVAVHKLETDAPEGEVEPMFSVDYKESNGGKSWKVYQQGHGLIASRTSKTRRYKFVALGEAREGGLMGDMFSSSLQTLTQSVKRGYTAGTDVWALNLETLELTKIQ